MPMQCAYHPDREPVGACVECGRLICVECKSLLGGKIYCTPCADKKFVHKEADPVSRQSAQVTAAPIISSPPPTSSDTSTTAAATSTLPKEVRKWSWGAFMLSWFWGIFNRVWIAFLIFIPVFGFIWWFVLGAKGSQWAWKKGKWDSLEHFKSTQKKWNVVGIILFALWVLSIIFVAINFQALSILLSEGGDISFSQ
jgi:hypothetical protein